MSALLYAMAKIIPAIAVGFILYKTKILDGQANHTLSWLVLHIACPCLVFSSIVSVDAQDKAQVYKLLVIGVILYVSMGLIAFLVTKVLRVPKVSEGVYQCLLIFGNVAFMGFPLVETLYGSEGLFYMALLNIHMNALIYSYGIFLIAHYSEEGKFSPKQIVNAAFIAAILACIFFLGGLKVPEIILTPLEFLGGLTSPLAMIVIGSSIASYDLKSVFNKWKIYVVAAIRLLIVPLITFFILKAFMGNTVMVKTIVIYMGMPTASAITMMSIVYKGDTESASAGVGFTTIAGFFTLSLLFAIMQLA